MLKRAGLAIFVLCMWTGCGGMEPGSSTGALLDDETPMEVEDAVPTDELLFADATPISCAADDAATDEALIALPWWIDPPYLLNPGTECVLISKFNADVQAGLKPDAKKYAQFKMALAQDGCWTPVTGFLPVPKCFDKLFARQEILIGKPMRNVKHLTGKSMTPNAVLNFVNN